MSSLSRTPDEVSKGLPTRKMRFGLFTFDPESGELYRAERRVRLQQQCALALRILLEHPGDLVTRDQLHRHLWPADTFVDFEDGLNTVVRKLRNALGDDADNPRFVETVPRRGYRFIAPVTLVSDAGNSSIQPGGITPEQRETEASARRVSSSRGFWLLVALALGGAGILIWRWGLAVRVPHAELITQLTHSGVVHPNQNMVTDGSRLYYIEREHGDWILQSMAVSGGPGTRVDLALPRYDVQDISTDRSEFLVRKLSPESDEFSVWISPVVGGPVLRVGDFSAMAAAFGPDRNTITYSSGNTVYLCSHDGSHSRAFFQEAGKVYRLRWSPDGKILAYTLFDSRTHKTSIWAIGADGKNRHELLPGWNLPKWEWMLGWSPDGKWLAFSSDSGSGRDIWLTDRNGRTPVSITSGPLRFDLPVFSRDGKTIFAIGGQQRGELLRYDAAKESFAPFLGGISAEQVDFSPDGKLVTYVSYPDRILWMSNADGSGAIRLTDSPSQAAQPKFSRDGKSIAFLAKPSRSASWKLFLIPSGGGTARPVPIGDVESAGFSWHVDGRSILMSCIDCPALRVVDPDSGTYKEVPNSEGLRLPRESPSGRYIVGEEKDSAMLEVLDLTTNKRNRIALDALYGTWSADERYIYFNRFHGSHPAMFRVRLDVGKEEEIFRLNNFAPAGSLSMYSGVTPDGSVLVLRDLGGADIFAIRLSKD